MKEVSFNPLTGVRVHYDFDPTAGEGGSHVLYREFERSVTDATLDRNAQLRGHGMGKEWRLAASIPAEVICDMLTKHGVDFYNPDHRDGVIRLLNSNEYRKARVNEFHI
jgi:hypothetical protein